MAKYRITVKPSSLPNEGEWEYEVALLSGRWDAKNHVVAFGYGTAAQFATESALAAAQRHGTYPPIVKDVEYE